MLHVSAIEAGNVEICVLIAFYDLNHRKVGVNVSPLVDRLHLPTDMVGIYLSESLISNFFVP